MTMVDSRQRIIEIFGKFDTVGDGTIHHRTIEQVLVGLGQSEAEAAQLLLQFGSSPDGGLVRYAEFVEWVLQGTVEVDPSASPFQRVEAVFRSWDFSNSGKISKSALVQVLKALRGDGEGEDIEELLAQSLSASPCAGDTEEVDYRKWLAWMFQEQAKGQKPLFKIWPSGKTYFAKLKNEMLRPPRVLDPEETQARYATLEEFKEKNKDNSGVMEQLFNRVVVCAKCKKPNGYTMKECNQCGSSLAGIEESKNDNIFMGFIYGVEKGRFPLKVSTRRETPDFLAFDDPLAVTVVHLCIIPTSVFCQDFRFLFTDPARGLKMLDDMMEFGRQACLDQYWSNPDFRNAYWNGQEPPKTTEEMQELSVLGFNFPPSMFQLHLQFQHGPLFPFHEHQLLRGNHYHHGRFYPFEYIRAALACGEAARMAVTADTPIEDVIRHIGTLGFDYDTMHREMMEKAYRLSERFPIWKKEDFEYSVDPDKNITSNETGLPVEGADIDSLQKDDSAKMKNYGVPTCSLYKYPKAPNEVKHFCR